MKNQKTSKAALTVIVAIAMLVGAAGASVLKTNSAKAQSTSPAPTAQSTPPATNPSSGSVNSAPGTFKSNENPVHEAKESAAWEAQENSGQAPWQHKSANGPQ